jgi:4-amino-4-deoxy-L-arabinose transferase-like glycosyltransferase
MTAAHSLASTPNRVRPAAAWLAGVRAEYALVALVALVALAAHLLPGPRTIDDAFITFRYSRNIATGEGFVYNPGVHTLGTTTPLFALLMAGIGLVANTGAYPWYALTVSALAAGTNTVLVYLLARRAIASPLIAALPALLWALSPMSVTFAVGGMETAVNTLWMLAACTAFAYGRGEWWIGICVGLGLLTRVDAALWIAPLLAVQLALAWRGRAGGTLLWRWLPWRTWLAAALVLLPWVLFAQAYFGSFIPNSVTAKRNAYLIEAGAALAQFLRTYANVFFTADLFGGSGALAAGLLLLVVLPFALLYAWREVPRLLPVLAYPLLYFATFAALNPLVFRWYMAPPLPALMLVAFIGLWAFLSPLARTPRMPWLRPLIASGVGGVCLATTLSAWTLQPDHGPNRPAPRMAWHAIEVEYQRMGEYLRDTLGVTASTRVASADIGAVGYFSGATIVDTVGLVTPELTAYYPVDPAILVPGLNYAIPPQLIADTEPAYLVTMEGFVRQGLAQTAWFNQAYALALEYPFPFYGRSMQLYVRADA